MKKLLRILPLSAVLLAGCGTVPKAVQVAPQKAAVAAPVIEKKVYTHTSGFSITYMSNWKPMEKLYGSLVTFFAPQTKGDLFRENFGISMGKIPTTMTVDQYYATTKKQLTKLIKGFKEDSNETGTVAGFAAKRIVYEGTQQSFPLKWQQVFFIKDKTIFILTYTASASTFDTFAPQIDDMIASLTVK